MIFKQQRNRAKTSAFTMMEVMVAMGISGLLLTIVATLALYSGRSLASMVNYVELNRSSRNALDIMTRDIRQADKLQGYTSSGSEVDIQFACHDSSGNPYTLDYHWYATNYSVDATLQGRLIRTDDSGTTRLLTDCESFSCELFRRVPDTNSPYGLYTTTDKTLCKLVQVKWTCARYVLGVARKTESIQTAKVGMRKQTNIDGL
jgi:prepilin-type N-terminal cleavage/methylation domain-containing protein